MTKRNLKKKEEVKVTSQIVLFEKLSTNIRITLTTFKKIVIFVAFDPFFFKHNFWGICRIYLEFISKLADNIIISFHLNKIFLEDLNDETKKELMTKVVVLLQKQQIDYNKINYMKEILLINPTIKYLHFFSKFKTFFTKKLSAFFVNIAFQKSLKSILNANIIKFYIEITKNIMRVKNWKRKFNNFVLFKDTINNAIFLIIENKKVNVDIDWTKQISTTIINQFYHFTDHMRSIVKKIDLWFKESFDTREIRNI